jgi:hypothetical protein
MAEQALLGLVRYGAKHLRGYNLFRFVTTKREKYKDEQEVRAMLWIRTVMRVLTGISMSKPAHTDCL